MISDSTANCELSDSLDIKIFNTLENGEHSINRTVWEIAIDLREEHANAVDSTVINYESVFSETDEQDGKPTESVLGSMKPKRHLSQHQGATA
jgi:hypothetical protein